MIKKRGMSPVIATVLIVFLSVSAVSLLAAYVIPFVRDSLEGTECVKYRDYYKIDTSYNYVCVQTSENNYYHGVSVKMVQNDSKVKGIGLVFYSDEGLAINKNIMQGDPANCDNVFLLKTCGSPSPANLEVPGAGSYSAVTYVFKADTKYNKVEVYPILEDGSVCGLSDSIALRDCGPTLDLIS